MLVRLKRIAWTLSAVAGAFLVYSQVAVRFIEPPADQRRSLMSSVVNAASNTARKLRAARLESLFSKGDWELDNPMVVETDKGMLLIRDYRSRPDGGLELKPCTLILYDASAEREGAERSRHCLVMRSAQGAVLRFDQEFNLTRGTMGRLQGGWLVGPVTIQRPESSPGADDALDLRTGGVQITRERITAPQEVLFRYGQNAGRGRDLIIALDPPKRIGRLGRDARQIDFGQVRSLELVHLEQLELHLEGSLQAGHGKASAAAADGTANAKAVPAKISSDSATPAPSDKPPQYTKAVVTCQGPFRFDFQKLVATLQDRVQVLRRNLDGPPDRLTCDLLSIYFQTGQRTEPEAAGQPVAGLPDVSALQVDRVAIQGEPAILDMPSESIAAQAKQLDYSFRTGLVRIFDDRQARLQYRENEFESGAIEYLPGEDGQLGRLVAKGPGRVRGALREHPEKIFEASWQDRLIVQPHMGDHAVSLISQAHVAYAGMGEFAAENLHVWLQETRDETQAEGEPPRYRYQPVRMLAESDVQLDSPQLAAAVQKVELWIRNEEPAPAAPAASASPAPSDPAQSQAAAKKPAQKFDVSGQHLQVQVVRGGEDVEVEHLILDGNVRLREVQAKPGEIPLDLSGDVVQVEQANTTRGRIRIQGRPARVAARGMSASGDTIQLNREHNNLSIPGPGQMQLPLAAQQLASRKPPHVAAGQPAAATVAEPLAASGQFAGNTLNVAWKGRMVFDGLVARFDQDIQLRGLQQADDGNLYDLLVMGNELDVTLNRRIDFSQTDQQAEADLARVFFRGGVFLQNTGRCADQPTSIDRMQVRDLSIDQQTGRLQAYGPGWGTSVRWGDQLSFAGGAGAGMESGSDKAAGLVFLRVDFEEEMVGDIHRRDLEFRGRVRTLYGPVTDWQQQLDPDPAEGLADGVFQLTSDRLAVAEMPSLSAQGASDVEVVADGNATVEGKSFTARGWRVSYARAKELLILEGDGRTDAELWVKGSVTPDAAAQQIRFWTHNNSIQVDGGRFFNLSQLGALTR